jgi:hypothetical protein
MNTTAQHKYFFQERAGGIGNTNNQVVVPIKRMAIFPLYVNPSALGRDNADGFSNWFTSNDKEEWIISYKNGRPMPTTDVTLPSGNIKVLTEEGETKTIAQGKIFTINITYELFGDAGTNYERTISIEVTYNVRNCHNMFGGGVGINSVNGNKYSDYVQEYQTDIDKFEEPDTTNSAGQPIIGKKYLISKPDTLSGEYKFIENPNL